MERDLSLAASIRTFRSGASSVMSADAPSDSVPPGRFSTRAGFRDSSSTMGGIATAADALEFIIAGATAVQVGTANFVDPFIWSKLLNGLRDYLQRHQVACAADLVGAIDTSTRDKQWISS